jgi:thiol-disulfide isomerase/thioredoxin
MFKLLTLVFLLIGLAPVAAKAQHEYSPLEEKTVNYKNWTLTGLADEKPVDLRSLLAGKKLVMVVYFAPWCGNWRFEAPVAAKLYEKYKAQGFEVIGVSEYASRDEVKAFFGPNGPPYPVVSESETRDDKQKTPHYGYRQLTGDRRNWGSPWNIFLEPAKLAKTGDVIAEKAWVVNGELIEEDVDKFISERLNATTATAIEPCKPEVTSQKSGVKKQ